MSWLWHVSLRQTFSDVIKKVWYVCPHLWEPPHHPHIPLVKNPNSAVNAKTLFKMPSIFCVHVCDQPQKQHANAVRRPDPLCECSCDPKWPTARPSWCLRLKVLLLIHREEPLALPAAELIVGHSGHSFPLRKQLPVSPATNSPQPRNAAASPRNSNCLQRCVWLCKQSTRVQSARSERARWRL